MNSIKNPCLTSCPGHSHRHKYLSKHNKLVITNHDQQIQTNLNTSKNLKPIIPNNPGIIIFDEAHSLKENFLGRLEVSLSYESLVNLKINKRITEYKQLLKSLKITKQEYVKSSQQSSMRYKINEKDLKIIKSIKDIIETNMIEKMQNRSYRDYSNEDDELEKMLNHLGDFLNERKNTSWIQFGKNIEMHYVSNHFNAKFKKFITDLSRPNKIIFMSGTLTSGEHTKEIKTNWGLNKDQYIYKKYPNVFNLNNQMLVYAPKKVPHPSKYPEEHLSEIIKKLPDILKWALCKGDFKKETL
ncbi:hypothetical protein [Carnobacterium funditum]|uniref:hypothetical protein n=1 Tax=Carnobacterium funditum TaxID=2752 RepID=UPI000550DE98|nr:hypothetical protein [Carnobacterium funditum]